MLLERVENGIKYLNEQVPGWFMRFNLNSFDINDGSKCLCGQLLGGYGKWRDEHDYEEAFDYGFADINMQTVYDLEDIWKEEIKKLREEFQRTRREKANEQGFTVPADAVLV